MRGVIIAALLLLLADGVMAQEAEGPTEQRAQTAYAEALEWVHRGMYDAAVDSFKKANRLDGGHCGACAFRIIEYGMRSRDFRDADGAAKQLIADARDPRTSALAHLARGMVQYQEGVSRNKADSFVEADREMQAACTAYANLPEAHFYDGLALARLNRDEDAKAQFGKFLSIAPPGDRDRERARRFVVNPALARARMAPPFSITTLDGRQVSLDSLAGKVVLIDFWATWCGGCREALPHLRQIVQRFSGEPLVVMSISLDKDEARWRDFIGKNNMTWLQYRDSQGEIAKLFGVQAIPHTFTIDADGVLQDEHIGDADIEGKLKKLCARAREQQEAPPSPVIRPANE